MPFIDVNELKSKELMPGFDGRMIHTDRLTIIYWDIAAGSILPEHSHEHEQITHILEGQFAFTIEGETQVIDAGKVAVIPSNARHWGKALTDCKALDVFQPVRRDYQQRMAAE